MRVRGQWSAGTARSFGFSLIELLVATAVAGVALAGAWAWLWSMAPPARSLQAGAQSGSAAAFALRALEHDLRDAVVLYVPTACAFDRGLLLEHRHPGVAPESLPIVWDPSREVLWRKTSSTYLADHVTRFGVVYLDTFGSPVTARTMGSLLTGVASVRLSIEISTGDRVETTERDIAVRTP